MVAILFWFHLMGIALWVGASFLLPLVIAPASQALDPAARLKFMGALAGRLSRWVFLAIGVVVVTGILQTNSIYGLAYLFGINVLSIKVIVAILMIANGYYLGLILPRRMQALAPAPGAPPSPEFLKVVRLQGMHGWFQAGMGAIVLLLVGILTSPGL